MSFVRTMLGDIRPEDLGFTYSHEHIVCRPAYWQERGEDDLLLDWDIGFCSNDPAYLKYGKFEELILSTDPKNEYVTYEELYEV